MQRTMTDEGLREFDPEVEQTFQLSLTTRERKLTEIESLPMEKPNVQPPVDELASAIVQPPLVDENFEMIPVSIQMLQNWGLFGGKDHEDPIQHLKNFNTVCSLHENLDAIKLCLFPFSLTRDAKKWLSYQRPSSICTWEQLAGEFLKKYFPATKTMKLRRDILSFTQNEQEPLHKAWKRFKGKLRGCPHHGIPDFLVMETFYCGLNQWTRSVVDMSAGGDLMSKTYADAKVLLDTMERNGFEWQSRASDANPVAIASDFDETTPLTEDRMSMLMTEVSTLKKKVDELSISVKQLKAIGHVNAPLLQQVICANCGQEVHRQDYGTSTEGSNTNNFNQNQGGKQWGQPQRDNQQWRPNQIWNGNVGGNQYLQNNW